MLWKKAMTLYIYLYIVLHYLGCRHFLWFFYLVVGSWQAYGQLVTAHIPVLPKKCSACSRETMMLFSTPLVVGRFGRFACRGR